jgi:hypothetical protein
MINLNDIIMILAIACSGAILPSRIDFLEHFKEYIGFGKKLRWRARNKVINYIIYFLHHLINCSCISFYIGWIYFNNIFIGFLVYFISYYIDNKMNEVSF